MDGRPPRRGPRDRSPAAPPLRPDAPLSAQRAFVVHLAPAASDARRRFRGRVEHLTSGRTAHFTSLDALLGFFAASLAADGVPPRRERPSAG